MGLDPQGRSVHIDEALERPHYYRCPECEEYLQVRHGEMRIWYFAHLKAEKGSPSCSLRTEAGITEKYRKSPVEKKEAARQLRIGLLANPYTDELRLLAFFPTPTWDEISRPESAAGILDSIRVEGPGLKVIPLPSSFHPREAEVLIDLDPNSNAFVISISSVPPIPSIVGTWTGPPITKGDIFVGDWHRAERVDPGTRVSEGDVVFMIPEDSEEAKIRTGKSYLLGNYRVLGTELTKETLGLVPRVLPKLDATASMFSVDVILPASADPRGLEPVEGPPRSTALIAIVPPANLDPGFEVVSVPFDAGKPMELPRAGNGIARAFRPSFPDEGSRRISIHWGDRHKFVHLHAHGVISRQTSAPWRQERPVGVLIAMEAEPPQVLVAWEQPNRYNVGVVANRPPPRIELVGPPGLLVELRGTLPGKHRTGRNVIEPQVRADDFIQIVQDWIEQGCSEVEVLFGPTGRILLAISAEKAKRTEPKQLSDEEIERRILQLGGPLPMKITWEFVREILNVEPKVAQRHHSVRGVTSRKRVRRVLDRLRRGNAN